MEPVFTMQYGEFAVADYLAKKVKDASVFIPASAQEKGIDLLVKCKTKRKYLLTDAFKSIEFGR